MAGAVADARVAGFASDHPGIMTLQERLARAAGATAIAGAAMLASTDASATCYFSVQSPASTVTAEGADGYAYAYTVTGAQGSCPLFYGPEPYAIGSFQLPYFSDAGITDIRSPAGWTYAIVDTDEFGLGSGAETLVWTATGGATIGAASSEGPAGSLSGFGYTASYSSVYSQAGVQTVSGAFPILVDPALPGSPDALAAGLVPTTFPSASVVPEPSTLLTMFAGLGLVMAARCRRA
jgi:hypothetical protein